eukprot:1176767-Rhodomonas_salina.2
MECDSEVGCRRMARDLAVALRGVGRVTQEVGLVPNSAWPWPCRWSVKLALMRLVRGRASHVSHPIQTPCPTTLKSKSKPNT